MCDVEATVMNARTTVLLFSALILGYPPTTHAQSAGTVLERYIKAVGGKKSIEKIVASEVSGTVTAMDGRSGTFTQKAHRPQLFTLTMSWGDSRLRVGFNGRAGWRQDDGGGPQTLYGEPASRIRAEASYVNTRLLTLDEIDQVSVTGRDQVRGHDVIVLVTVTADGIARRLFFDAGSYLLLKDEQQTGGGLEERFYDDYRQVEGVLEPHQIEWHRNGQVFRLAVEHVSHNGPVDRTAFDVPGVPAAPPVNLSAMLSAAERNEQGRIPTSYSFRDTHTRGQIDAKGQVTYKETDVYEAVRLADGGEVRRLVRRGGQPLSDTERRREDERVEAALQAYERRRASNGADDRARPAPVSSARVINFLPLGRGMLAAYRRVSEFSGLRREMVEDRPAIVVEFQSGQNVKPATGMERQAAAVAGTLWIDEVTQQAIRIESF
jgi:hypothetical protein